MTFSSYIHWILKNETSSAWGDNESFLCGIGEPGLGGLGNFTKPGPMTLFLGNFGGSGVPMPPDPNFGITFDVQFGVKPFKYPGTGYVTGYPGCFALSVAVFYSEH